MKTATWGTHHALSLVVIATAMSVGAFAPSASYGQTSKSVVPVNAEPDHHIRFENGKVRMYEVMLPKGKSTMMHEHRADNFQVFFNDSKVTVEPKGGLPATFPVRAGFVAFSSTGLGTYTHRVEGAGDTPFRVIAIELLSASSATAGTASVERPSPPFNVALRNPKGRAYRVGLDPGESTKTFTRPANTAIFAISSGRISEQAEGKAPKQWEFNSGNFRWSETPAILSLKNESSTRVELVEVEIF